MVEDALLVGMIRVPANQVIPVNSGLPYGMDCPFFKAQTQRDRAINSSV